MDARPFIDSLDFAENSRQITAETQLAALPRLLDILDNPEGSLKYTIHGGVDKLGNRLLDISITGVCHLRCQRCLAAMDHPLRITERLLLADQASLDALSDDEVLEDESFESILADAHLDVLALLEEEIILSLPIAPRHELGDCQTAEGLNKQKDNPFAVLMTLKRN
jgi:uncharacterized protein